MTAIDGSAFDFFGDLVEAPSPGRTRANPGSVRRLVVVLAAGVLLVGGAAGVRAALDSRATDVPVVAPATLFAVLSEPQGAADVLAEEPGTALLDAASTRLLAETTAGSHYLAVTTTGLVCLVTVPAGDVAELGCTDPVASEHLLRSEIGSPEPRTLALVPDGLAPAADGAAWERVGPNLWAHDGLTR